MIFRGEGDTFSWQLTTASQVDDREWMQRQIISDDEIALSVELYLTERSFIFRMRASIQNTTWSKSIKRGGFRTMLGVPLLT